MAINAILSVEGPALTPRERDFLRDADPWGIILFARNIENPGQLRRLTFALREALGRDAPVLVDQEGGRVQRMVPPHWRRWLPPMDEARRALAQGAPVAGAALRKAPGDPAWTPAPASGADTAPPGDRIEAIPDAVMARAERIFWLRGALIGAELRASGIDVNCSPCADTARSGTHPFLMNRCFSDDPAVVARLARATADGLVAGGCLPVVKHLPGHGGATVDSHHALPRVDDDREALAARDFRPFRALADLALGMTGHIVFPAWDDAAPATQSAQMIRVIRDEIGFEGLLMTDDLGMQALHGDIGHRARESLAAGCDIALHCNGKIAESIEVAASCQQLAGEARSRAARAMAMRPAATSVDTAALAAEFAGLTGEG